MTKRKKIIYLIYNNEVLQCRTCSAISEKEAVIEQWTMMYALDKPKKHPVYIQIASLSKKPKRKLIQLKAA